MQNESENIYLHRHTHTHTYLTGNDEYDYLRSSELRNY